MNKKELIKVNLKVVGDVTDKEFQTLDGLKKIEGFDFGINGFVLVKQ